MIKQRKTEIKLFSKGSELTTKRVWFVLLIANNRKRRALLVTVGFWIWIHFRCKGRVRPNEQASTMDGTNFKRKRLTIKRVWLVILITILTVVSQRHTTPLVFNRRAWQSQRMLSCRNKPQCECTWNGYKLSVYIDGRFLMRIDSYKAICSCKFYYSPRFLSCCCESSYLRDLTIGAYKFIQ